MVSSCVLHVSKGAHSLIRLFTRKQISCFIIHRLFSCQTTRKSDVTTNMGKKAYWEAFYESRTTQTSHGNPFEWFVPYEAIRDTFHSSIATLGQSGGGTLRLAELGCGTSGLALALALDYPSCHITCMDFSMNALMQSKTNTEMASHSNNSSKHHVDFVAADICNIPLRGNIFDVVYEKGTTDALLKSKSTRQKVDKLLVEAFRLLTPNGLFLQFSDEPPEFRLDLLEKVKTDLHQSEGKQLSVSFTQLPETGVMEYFAYKIISR